MANDVTTNLVVLNYESRFISNILPMGGRKALKTRLPAARSGLVLLRDPLNNFARAS